MLVVVYLVLNDVVVVVVFVVYVFVLIPIPSNIKFKWIIYRGELSKFLLI